MSRCIFFLLAMFLVLCALQGLSAQEDPDSIQTRPTRPEKFTSQAQLNEYVRKLQEYYNVNGRGRYGKRDIILPEVVRRFASAIRRPNDLYDFLSQYDYDRSNY